MRAVAVLIPQTAQRGRHPAQFVKPDESGMLNNCLRVDVPIRLAVFAQRASERRFTLSLLPFSSDSRYNPVCCVKLYSGRMIFAEGVRR